MIALGSVVGFVLVFVAVTWLLSLAAYAALHRLGPALRRRGPRAERTGAALAIVLPPALGALVALVLAGHSLIIFWRGMDHCQVHGDHLHLCVVHGGAWFSKLWAVFVVAGIAGVAMARLTRTAWMLWQARARLRRIATLSTHTDSSVVIAPSRRLFCFVAGMRRPRIYASSHALERLAQDEWRAVLAHERTHISNGDLWRTALLGALAMTGAPIVAGRCLDVWRSATERLCDQSAARETGDASSVASAMLVMATGDPCPTFAFTPRPDQLDDRVRAVLEETEDGGPTARRLVTIALMACGLAAVVVAASAGPLHHALETILGTL